MTLRGSTTEFPLDVLLRLLGDTKKTGELAIRGDGGEGALGIAEGRVVTAVFGEESPIPALGAIFRIGDATFEFTPWDEAPPANLEGDLEENLRKAEEYRVWLAGVREVIPHDGIRFRLSERAADQGAVTFTADRWRVVMAVNSQPDVLQLATNLHIDRDSALRTLAGLVRDGVIETIDTPVETEPVALAAPPAPVAPEPAAQAAPAEDWTAALLKEVEPTAAEPDEPVAPALAEPAPAEPTTPAPEEPVAPTPAPQGWGAPATAESAPPVDDRLAALFGTPAPAAPVAPAPPVDAWTTPAPAAPADQWTTPTAPAEPVLAEDPRLSAMSAPAPPQAPANEWAAPPTDVSTAPPPQKKGIFGLFKRDEAVPEPATRTTLLDRSATSRAGLLAAFSNALLTEYNRGHYGKGRVDDRIPGLLMRVDEQADPIDRPLPVVDDRLDVQALERVSMPEIQAVPYLALLVSTIYGDAEKAFGRDKAKRGYKAAQQHVFGGDVAALGGPDLAGKLPKV